MSSLPLSPQERAQRWGSVAKWAAVIVAGYLFAPIAMATITGLLGLIVVGVVGALVWALAPAVESAAVNLRLKMLKAEAAKNPIETLEAEYLRRSTLLDQRKNAIENFDSKTETFGDKLAGFKRDYPTEAPKYQAVYDKMQLLLKRQQEQWREANRGLTAFKGEITKAKAMWDMAMAANEARAGSGLDEDSFYAQLKTETALDSVQDGMNRAFSQLDTLMLEGDSVETSPITVQVTSAQPALPASSEPLDIATDASTKSNHKLKSSR